MLLLVGVVPGDDRDDRLRRARVLRILRRVQRWSAGDAITWSIRVRVSAAPLGDLSLVFATTVVRDGADEVLVFHWRPDPAWPLPVLPDGWDRAT